MIWKLMTLLPRWIAAEHEEVIKEYRDKPVSLQQWITEILIVLVIAVVVFL